MIKSLQGIGASEAHAQMIVNSYKKWTGKDLILIDNDKAKTLEDQLFKAPKAVLSHGLESDPILNYGNLMALRVWEMDWDTFTKMPSRLTAEPLERSERENFLNVVNEKGYIDNYTGIRISNHGKRFNIVNAVVWNLVDDNGHYAGQAAAFDEYRYCK